MGGFVCVCVYRDGGELPLKLPRIATGNTRENVAVNIAKMFISHIHHGDIIALPDLLLQSLCCDASINHLIVTRSSTQNDFLASSRTDP